MAGEERPAARGTAVPVEVLAAWAILGAFTVAVAVTYARLDPSELYNVSRSGFAGGAGRALVFLGFPVSFAVIAAGLTAFAAVREGLARPTARAAAIAVTVAVLLCATAAIPGVVDQDDLDAKPANVAAAAGVALMLAFTAWACWRQGVGRLAAWGGPDRVRIALAAMLVVLGLPWFAAEAGYDSASIPAAGTLFLDLDQRPGDEGHAAVHAGDHHGTDGVILVLTVLILSRSVPAIGPGKLRAALLLYLSLGFVYGLAIAAQDWWQEQIIKRDWTTHGLPDVLQPAPSGAWAGILILAGMLAFTWERSLRRGRQAAAGAP